MTRLAIAGWIMSFGGTALWLYGYLVTGHPSIVNWHAVAPAWIAEFLPNVESEIGLAVAFIALIPMYWPTKK